MGPTQLSEEKKAEILERAKTKIANSQKKPVERKRKRRNSLLDQIRKEVSRGRYHIPYGTMSKTISSGQRSPPNPKGTFGDNINANTRREKSTIIKDKSETRYHQQLPSNLNESSGPNSSIGREKEESVSMIRKGSVEKVTVAAAKAQFVGTSELPKMKPNKYQRRSSFSLRKYPDNELGYEGGRKYHRHSHQKQRQEKYYAYKHGEDYRSSTDLEND